MNEAQESRKLGPVATPLALGGVGTQPSGSCQGLGPQPSPFPFLADAGPGQGPCEIGRMCTKLLQALGFKSHLSNH